MDRSNYEVTLRIGTGADAVVQRENAKPEGRGFISCALGYD
jgi:hypothetical protein